VSKLGGSIKLSRQTFKERRCFGFDSVGGPEVVGVGLKIPVNRRKEIRSKPGSSVGYPHNNHG